MACEPIRSLQNPRIKHAVRMRDARYRRHTKQLIIDGPRELLQAFRGGLTINEIYVDEGCSGLDSILREFSSSASEFDCRTLDPKVTRVSSSVMERLGYGERATSIVAIAEQPDLALNERPANSNPRAHSRGSDFDGLGLVLVIDRVEKPGNLGAMLRTADAVGVSCVLLSDPICEVWNPNAIRSSLGAIFRVPIAVGSSEEVISWLRQESYEIYAARVQASELHSTVNWANHSAIVVGSEAEGLGDPWIREGIHGVRLPMQGSVDSLNVSVSVAVLLYHVATTKNWFQLP